MLVLLAPVWSIGHAQALDHYRGITSLGLTTYGGRLLYTTHVAHYLMGADLDLYSRGPDLGRNFGEDLGKYFFTLTQSMDWGGQTFVERLDASILSTHNVKTWEYYPASFGGGVDDGAAASLSLFRSVANITDGLFGLDEASATAFKLKYVSLYHVLRSLRELRSSSHVRRLEQSALDALDEITTDATAVQMLDPATIPFRNTIVHYGLDTRIQTVSLDEAEPLAGLAGVFFPGDDFASLSTKVSAKAHSVAAALDKMAGV